MSSILYFCELFPFFLIILLCNDTFPIFLIRLFTKTIFFNHIEGCSVQEMVDEALRPVPNESGQSYSVLGSCAFDIHNVL